MSSTKEKRRAIDTSMQTEKCATGKTIQESNLTQEPRLERQEPSTHSTVNV